MLLNDEGIKKNREEYIKKGYHLPEYDRKEIEENTRRNPEWIHFGAGNIFRAYQANLAQKLIESGNLKTGVTVCEGYDYEIIDKLYRPYDNLCILATLKSDGTIDKSVIGSVVSSLALDENRPEDIEVLKDIFAAPSLKMCSFTITEKGYKTRGYMEKIVRLLLHRYNSGAYPIAFVSMDNCSHNGDKLREGVLECANHMVEIKEADAAFVDYINDSRKVSFPWSMIDKITPRPDESVYEELSRDGIADLEPEVTSKNTYAAPFVNAEETEYLVIEDDFPNGKIPLDKVGVIYTARETVDATERMKVCTCLNPLHTALAIFGCLLGYKTIHDEMEDADLEKLVYNLGNKEGMPVVTDPKVLSPADFLEAVLTKRLPNPFMPDTPQRIATDTSQKIPIRFGETIKAYRRSGDLDTDDLVLIPLVLAGYLRYLKGVDDEGVEFDPSSDPMLDELRSMPPEEVLHQQAIFACDLFEDSLGERILGIYKEMCEGEGSVRKCLHKYVTISE